MRNKIFRIIDLAVHKDTSSEFWSFLGFTAIELFLLWMVSSDGGFSIPFYAHIIMVAGIIWTYRELAKANKKLDKYYKDE